MCWRRQVLVSHTKLITLTFFIQLLCIEMLSKPNHFIKMYSRPIQYFSFEHLSQRSADIFSEKLFSNSAGHFSISSYRICQLWYSSRYFSHNLRPGIFFIFVSLKETNLHAEISRSSGNILRNSGFSIRIAGYIIRSTQTNLFRSDSHSVSLRCLHGFLRDPHHTFALSLLVHSQVLSNHTLRNYTLRLQTPEYRAIHESGIRAQIVRLRRCNVFDCVRLSIGNNLQVLITESEPATAWYLLIAHPVHRWWGLNLGENLEKSLRTVGWSPNTGYFYNL